LPFVHPKNGLMPNLGANDGSRLLPLSTLAHGDTRSTLQHAFWVGNGERAFPAGVWDEQCVWFGQTLADKVRARPPRTLVYASGNARSQRGESELYLRAPDHRHHRPSQADSLHVDLWHRGENLALDPGTYLYSGAPPWNNSLCDTRVHNTVSVGDKSQMTRHGRFFWTHWNRSVLDLAKELPGGTLFFAHTHADAARRFLHQRLVLHSALGAIVLDRVTGPEPTPIRVHWNLCDGFAPIRPSSWMKNGVLFCCEARPHGLAMSTSGDPLSHLGWHAPTYGQKHPCLAVELETVAHTASFYGLFAFSPDLSFRGLGQALWTLWQEGQLSTAREHAIHAFSQVTTVT
jgi:hypothetical protein